MKDFITTEFFGVKENEYGFKKVDKFISASHLLSKNIYTKIGAYSLPQMLLSTKNYIQVHQQKKYPTTKLPTFVTQRKHLKDNFKVFQTLHAIEDFLVIGLSIVKKIVNLYQGVILVNSKLNVSSTFIFTLIK